MNSIATRQASTAVSGPPRYHGWQVAGLGLLANLFSATGPRPRRQGEFYERLKRPAWAPPAWAFGPAWAINNAATLWADLRLLNLPPDTPKRRELLWLQGAGWVLFSTYSRAAFGTQSNVLSFLWSGSYWLVTLASTLLGRKVDRKFALAHIPLLTWLTLATALSAYIMVNNPDPLFGIPAPRRSRVPAA